MPETGQRLHRSPQVLSLIAVAGDALSGPSGLDHTVQGQRLVCDPAAVPTTDGTHVTRLAMLCPLPSGEWVPLLYGATPCEPADAPRPLVVSSAFAMVLHGLPYRSYGVLDALSLGAAGWTHR